MCTFLVVAKDKYLQKMTKTPLLLLLISLFTLLCSTDGSSEEKNDSSIDNLTTGKPVRTYQIINFAKPITRSTTLPTTLISEFFRLRRNNPTIERNDGIKHYVSELVMEDRVALAQLLLDDRDVRVRAFAIATLAVSVDEDETKAALVHASKRIGKLPIKRAAEYALLMYDIENPFLISEE